LREPKEFPSIDFDQPRSYTPKFLADKILTTRSSIEGERKLVTVLFADVANYTSIAEKLDPEEVHQIMDECFKILMDEIHRYEGTINQFTGDGVMALFGAPVAREDHAQRACHAALSIQNALKTFSGRLKRERGVKFEMRIGLNSGPVVVGSIGDDLRMDYTAVGDTTNLASRVQNAAKPGEAYVSQATHNKIQGYFQDELVAEMPFKGKSEPQRIYRVIGEDERVRSRFEAGLVRGITELVGRRPEMEAFIAAYEHVKGGDAQILDVVGEAGVGKSRLCYEFRKVLGNDVTFLTGLCIHYGRTLNFLPVIDIVKAAFGIEEGMTREEVGSRIEERAREDLARMIPFYRNLLSLEVEDEKFKSLEPEGLKFGTFEAVKDLLISLSADKPLVLLIDDVHWIDKLSEEFFAYFSRCILDNRILLVAAYRPEGSLPWAKGAHYQRLGLETLSANSSVRLIRHVLGGLPLETELEKKIAEMAGGNPFFVEEIVRNLLERGDLVKAGDRYFCTRPVREIDIPDTVQGVLAARMDRLSEDLKRTMQVASVIGRDFAFRILQSISQLGEELKSQLSNLVGLEILYEKTLYPELEYIFKHALTQEVAYNSLLRQRRKLIHGRVVDSIEELYPKRLEEHYELLAYHSEQSGNAVKAVNYLVLAGTKSRRRGMAVSACDFFGKALEVAANNHVQIDTERKIELHHGLGMASFDTGDISRAMEEYKEAINLSRQYGMRDYEREALFFHSMPLIYQTPTDETEKTFGDAISRAREMGDKGLEGSILTIKGVNAVLYGDPASGYQIQIDAERIAMESGDPRHIFYTRYVRSATERWLGHPEKTIELSEGMLEMMLENLSVTNLMFLIVFRGVALAEVGRIEEGIKIIQNGIDLSEKFGLLLVHAALYNCLGYCLGELCLAGRALEFNLKAQEIARNRMRKYPRGVRQFAEQTAQSSVNLMENYFDQDEVDSAWTEIESLKDEAKSEDFDHLRYRWESRMDYLSAQMLLKQNELDQAESLIENALENAREKHLKKREGGFQRLLGDLHVRLNNPENAVRNISDALQTLNEVGNPRQLWQAHASLACAFDKMGKPFEARAQWRSAAEVINNLANGLSDGELKEGFLQARAIRDILSRAEG
jgi:class 3 adenylate cyclase/tetratricopeptide (TPR) repeat protein